MPSIGSLIGTGIAFGFVHVLTGPDHLSALATLSANVGPRDSFALGIRWGIGHSTGLVVVAVVLIAISTGDTVQVPEKVTIVFEALVGVFMLLLGMFGMLRAWRKRPWKETANTDELPLTGTNGSVVNSANGEASMSMADVGQVQSIPGASSTKSSDPVEMELLSHPESRGYCTCFVSCVRSLSTKAMACGIGIIHGLAGPGGVLGVIPAVQLKDWRQSTLYLGSFCITSTLVMGCFAALYGTCTEKLGKQRGKRWEFAMECISSALSIIVGILWLTLLALGKLEDVFP